MGWRRLWTKLYRYAIGTLHFASIDAARAGRVEAMDLVHALVVMCLSGRLEWALPEHATDEEIVRYACRKLYGMRSTQWRHAARTLSDDTLDERADEGPDAFALLMEQRAIADVLHAFEHDAEVSAYVRGMVAGNKRADMMDVLGCTAEQADVVRKRMLRGVAMLHATNDRSEDGPPSSGPRGSYHETQATEERRGAPREPARGALRAGRRR